MSRFLQRGNRFTKAFFIVAAAVGMVWLLIRGLRIVLYLIPGLTLMAPTADTYAIIYPHWYSRVFSSGETVTQEQVSQKARQQIQRQNPQYADNPAIMRLFEQQAGQQLVQEQVLLIEAEKLGIEASDTDVSNFLQKGQFGEYLFPNGEFIGKDRYADFIARQFSMSVTDFERAMKQDLVNKKLKDKITAGVTVSDDEVRAAYCKMNVRIKFDYALVDFSNQLKEKTADLAAKAKAENNLAKVAKEMGASFHSSELMGAGDQIPLIGQIGQTAPQLFELKPGEFSGPISTGYVGLVARLVDKQEPGIEEIAKNFSQTREELLDHHKDEVFNNFAKSLMDEYQKKGRIVITREKAEESPNR